MSYQVGDRVIYTIAGAARPRGAIHPGSGRKAPPPQQYAAHVVRVTETRVVIELDAYPEWQPRAVKASRLEPARKEVGR